LRTFETTRHVMIIFLTHRKTPKTNLTYVTTQSTVMKFLWTKWLTEQLNEL